MLCAATREEALEMGDHRWISTVLFVSPRALVHFCSRAISCTMRHTIVTQSWPSFLFLEMCNTVHTYCSTYYSIAFLVDIEYYTEYILAEYSVDWVFTGLKPSRSATQGKNVTVICITGEKDCFTRGLHVVTMAIILYCCSKDDFEDKISFTATYEYSYD